MIWALGSDDHNGLSCGDEPYPLLNTISNCLSINTGMITSPSIPTTERKTEMTTTVGQTTMTPTTTTPATTVPTTTTPTTTSPTTATPSTTTPTTTTPTTTKPTNTSRAPCKDRNMTVYVASDDERALVEITADDRTELSIGSHVIYRDGCTINVNVIKNCE